MNENTFMAYLTSRRMSSLGNLAGHFNQSVETMTPLIRILELQNRLRLSLSHCPGDCGACHSCENDAGPTPLSEKTIVISLERMEQPL